MTPVMTRGRWLRRAAWSLAVLTALACLAEWVTGRMVESRLRDRLAAHGWTLERQAMRWSPWGGLLLTQVKLQRGSAAPAVEAARISADFPLWGGSGNASWKIGPGALVLRDQAGTIRLQDVAVELRTSAGEVRVAKAVARHESLYVSATGAIQLAPSSGVPSELRLSAVRGALDALQMTSGAFHVDGTFQIDARGETTRWAADLRGEGKQIGWHGVPLREGRAAAKLSDGPSVITADLVLPAGASHFEVAKEGWEGSPFHIEGTLADAAGRSDEFSGSYQPGAKVWTLDRLAGSADLWQLAKDVPALAAKIPAEVRCESFPGIQVTDARWSPASKLTVKSVETDGTGKLTATHRGRELEISRLSGGVSYDGETWLLDRAAADLLGGRVTASGRYRAPLLGDAQVTVESMAVARLKAWAGEKASGKGVLSANFQGNVNTQEKTLSGRGSLRMTHAPVMEVPLLDQTWDLFTAMIPGVKRSREGEFLATFIAGPKVIDVPRFEAKGGTLTVSAKGQVDLVKRRVDGVARGKLTGLPGLVTQPLSRLLEMEVAGPYDDIRVKPLGPAKLASNAASGTVGVAVDTLEEAGKITGTVIAESVKLPFRWLKKPAEE